MESDSAPMPQDANPATYEIHVDWPDWPDGTAPNCMRCDARELRRTLHMLPSRFPRHTLNSAPLMIEIHEV